MRRLLRSISHGVSGVCEEPRSAPLREDVIAIFDVDVLVVEEVAPSGHLLLNLLRLVWRWYNADARQAHERRKHAQALRLSAPPPFRGPAKGGALADAALDRCIERPRLNERGA